MFTLRSHVKLILGSTAAGLLCFCLGCSLPVIPADDTYEVLGGVVQRDHPSLGRANSVFDLSDPEISAATKAVQAAPSLFKDPQPLDLLKHSPIIP